MSSITLRLQLR